MKEQSVAVGFARSPARRWARKGGQLLAVFLAGLGLPLALTWLLGGGPRAAHAESFTVNTTADVYNGSCATVCSLRDAIVLANHNGEANTISLGSGTYTLTRGGAPEDAGLTGDLDITGTHPITIEGVGAEQTLIDGNDIDRVLDIRPGAGTAVISGVTIYNGTAAYESPFGSEGGGVRAAGASLVLINTVVRNNNAYSRGGGIRAADAGLVLINTVVRNNASAYGGGVYVVSGSATLSGGQIADNYAACVGGGVYVDGGSATLSGVEIISNTARSSLDGRGAGVFVGSGSVTLSGGQIAGNQAGSYGGGGLHVAGGSVTVSGVQVVSNAAGYGGGVYVDSGSVTLSGGQIADNTARIDSGGGVHVASGSVTASGVQIAGNRATGSYSVGGGVYVGSGNATLSETQVVSNTATYCGGGVHVGSGRATLSGAQIVSNTATYGGGVYNYAGTLSLVNSTVSGNRAIPGGGGLFSSGTSALTYTTVAGNTAAAGGGGIHRGGGTVRLQDTIVAYNGTNCNAALTSDGHNLEDGHTCGLNAAGDMMDTDPLMGPLTADRGSLVHPLLIGSPAIDRGVCIADITADQRGVTRPQGAACDIGAYEWWGRVVYLPVVFR